MPQASKMNQGQPSVVGDPIPPAGPSPRNHGDASEEGRAPFSRDEVMADLRQALWASANHIAVAGPDVRVAHAFLGLVAFDPDGSLGRDDPDPQDIRLERFPIAAIIGKAYDFAFQVGPRAHRHAMPEMEVARMRAFQEASPRGLWIDMTTPIADDDSPLCRTIDAAYARWGGGSTVRDLALLANMTEPAVRNSLSKEGIKLKSFTKDDKNGRVDYEEASRWLQGRRGYVPTLEPEPTDPFYVDDFRRLLSAQGFGAAVPSTSEGRSLGQVARAAEVDPEWLLEVVTGREARIDVEALKRVAVAVSVDVPSFVGRCVEMSVRAGLPPPPPPTPFEEQTAAMIAAMGAASSSFDFTEYETDPNLDGTKED